MAEDITSKQQAIDVFWGGSIRPFQVILYSEYTFFQGPQNEAAYSFKGLT